MKWLFKRKQQKTDAELVSGFYETGNKDLFGDLFEAHVSKVYGVCLFYLRRRDLAEDATMHIFEKLMVDLRKTRVENFKGWLSFVVRNHCISELRKAGLRHFVSDTYLDFELQPANAETEMALQQVNEQQLLDHLQIALPQLKDKQRRCVEWFYLQQKSYKEMADLSGWPVKEIKSHLQNAKRNLKLILLQNTQTR
jgi:RNA polymerase sigma factor (sigma-70 family)